MASVFLTISQSFPKFMSIESMVLTHLILCHPLLLLPSIFPSIRVFSNESALLIRWPKYWSFSFSVSPSNEYSGLISFRMDWLDRLPCSWKDSQESPPTFNLSQDQSFQMNQFFTSGGQSIGVSASVSVLPMNTQDWFPLGWVGWISLQPKGLSRVLSNPTIQEHQFFSAQLFL